VAKKKRIPDEAEIIWCVKCRKPINGKGWYGPGCMGHEPPRERVVQPGNHWA
jgi:hypothetical protein